MSLTGYLSEFSLAELFQFLEQGNKTGLLTISPWPRSQGEATHMICPHLIWFRQGRIVAASNHPDHQGLLLLIQQRGWLGDRAVFRLASFCEADAPLGICFKSQGLLNAEQLKQLFYIQVMKQVCQLFTLKEAKFYFDANATLANGEMTGLNAPAMEVTLAGLRALKDWSALEDKLPAPDSAIISVARGKPTLRLKQVEWQVWEYTDGTVPLTTIAEQLQLPLHKVQTIVFRLIMVGLVEELPLLVQEATVEGSQLNLEGFAPGPERLDTSPRSSHAPNHASDHTESGHHSNPKVKRELPMSQAFLQNLVGFLHQKGI